MTPLAVIGGLHEIANDVFELTEITINEDTTLGTTTELNQHINEYCNLLSS